MHITVTSKNDPAFEAMFDNLIRDVFGFSFAPWLSRKVWNERYESYSIIQDGEMLSNVCIYKTDRRIGGQAVRAHQFGAVATRESERKRGLSRQLMDHVLSLYPDVPAFLYANPSVIDFYPQFGFRQADTYQPYIVATIDNPPGKVRQYSGEDAFVYRMLCGKRVYSDVVDCMNTQSIALFHLLLSYPEDLYFLSNCGALVVAKQEGNKLFLADVVCERPITFEELKKELPFFGIESVAFGFCPDWLGVQPNWEQIDGNKEPFFLRGDWNLPVLFRFPALSAT